MQQNRNNENAEIIARNQLQQITLTKIKREKKREYVSSAFLSIEDEDEALEKL